MAGDDNTIWWVWCEINRHRQRYKLHAQVRCMHYFCVHAKLINDMEFSVEKGGLYLLIVSLCLSGIQSQNNSKLYLEQKQKQQQQKKTKEGTVTDECVHFMICGSIDLLVVLLLSFIVELR